MKKALPSGQANRNSLSRLFIAMNIKPDTKHPEDSIERPNES
jgi:hypothetical protein